MVDRSGPAVLKSVRNLRDLERSYVYDRNRGAIDRLQSLFGDDPGVGEDLYPLAEEKLADAARDGSRLLARAERTRG